MINLLPNDYRESLRYAHKNSIILRWTIGLIVMLLLTGSTIFIGRAYLQMETRRYSKLNEETRAELKAQDLEETLDKVQNISDNLKLIVQVLQKQVIFSELIKQVGAVMPPGTILSDVEISEVQGGIDLTARSTNQNTATQIQINLTDPKNKLFDQVDIVSVTCEEATDPDYPCRVTMRALFTKNNPFMFISNSRTQEGS